MGKQHSHDEQDSKGSSVPPPNSTALLLLGTFADTTWRMLVPSVGLTLLGVWLDSICGVKPWLMVVGIILGAVFAVLLVKQQFISAKKG